MDVTIASWKTVSEPVERAASSQVYLKWEENHHQAFLSSIFFHPPNVQIGFYDSATDKIFSVDFNEQKEVVHSWEDDIFRDPEKGILPLHLEEDFLLFQEIEKKAQEFFRKKYHLPIIRSLFVLEQRDSPKAMWNITFVTHSSFILLLQVHPCSGEVISEKIMQFTN